MRWLPAAILLLGAVAAWGLARGRAAPEVHTAAPPPPRLEVIAARPGPHSVRVRAHGTVAPRAEVQVVAETAGRVQRLAPSLEVGSFFRADEILVALDPRDAELALERARAAVLRAESERHIARARVARQRTLAARSVASAAALEESEHVLAVAAAGLRDARAARDQAQRELERTSVRLSFEGRVRARSVDVGQFVSRGQALASVYAVDFAEVRLPVPEEEAAYLDLAALEGGSGPAVWLRAPLAGGVREWRARIVRAEGEIDARSRMLHVVARVEDPWARSPDTTHAPLTVGLFVEAEIEGRAFPGSVVIPSAALRGDDVVFVLDDLRRPRARHVEIVRRSGDHVLIGSGLRAGDRVCAAAALAREGHPVEPALATVTAGVFRSAGLP